MGGRPGFAVDSSGVTSNVTEAQLVEGQGWGLAANASPMWVDPIPVGFPRPFFAFLWNVRGIRLERASWTDFRSVPHAT